MPRLLACSPHLFSPLVALPLTWDSALAPHGSPGLFENDPHLESIFVLLGAAVPVPAGVSDAPAAAAADASVGATFEAGSLAASSGDGPTAAEIPSESNPQLIAGNDPADAPTFVAVCFMSNS